MLYYTSIDIAVELRAAVIEYGAAVVAIAVVLIGAPVDGAELVPEILRKKE